MIKQNWIDPKYGERVVLQYKSFLQDEVKLYHEKFNSFERSKDRLDKIFFSTFEVHKNYENLSVKSYQKNYQLRAIRKIISYQNHASVEPWTISCRV